MWIEGHWFSKDLLSQVILIWLLGVAVAGIFVWRLARKKKIPAAKNPPAKNPPAKNPPAKNPPAKNPPAKRPRRHARK